MICCELLNLRRIQILGCLNLGFHGSKKITLKLMLYLEITPYLKVN